MDVGLGQRLGVTTVWASYGLPTKEFLARLAEFSPPQNVHKNASLPEGDPQSPVPDHTLKQFSDLLACLS
jgi:hypothetical protein